MRIEDITPDLVNLAIEIYLQHAYETEALRAAHRVHFDPEMAMDALLEEFEREDANLRAYALRLGCQHYPHMKMALWEAYYRGEFVFGVDRHDGFDFEKTGADLEAWINIQGRNHETKLRIESAWYENGVPTLRRLKEKRLSMSDIMREFSGHSVLVVDNDHDAGAILEMILSSAGYGCIWVEGVRQAREVLADPEQRGRCGMALVDVMLSDGSGTEVVRTLRATPETRNIPVVLTSAMNGSDVYTANADAYLRKPYAAAKLLETVNAVLRRQYDDHDHLLNE